MNPDVATSARCVSTPFFLAKATLLKRNILNYI